jgi:hypothetical protein
MTTAFTGLIVVSLVACGLVVLCFREMRLRRACQMLIARLLTTLHNLYRTSTGDSSTHATKQPKTHYRR